MSSVLGRGRGRGEGRVSQSTRESTSKGARGRGRGLQPLQPEQSEGTPTHPTKRKLPQSGPAAKQVKSTPERGREELPWNSSERRVDTLSRLLSCNSQCTAIAVVDDELWVCANEVSDVKGGEEQTRIIKEVMEYFQKRGSKELGKTETARRDLFNTICQARINMNNVMAAVHGERLPLLDSKIISEIVGATFEPEPSSSRKVEALGEEYTPTRKLCRKIRKDFRKTEQLVQLVRRKSKEERDLKKTVVPPLGAKTSKKDHEEEQKRLVYFSKAIAKGYILKPSDQNPGNTYKFHAESILVSHILRKILDQRTSIERDYTLQNPLKIYIGIAKLCCLNCRCLLEATNEYFKKQKLPVLLQWRGKHDIAFEWHPPLVFYEGYAQGVLEEMKKKALSRGLGPKGNKGNKHLRAIAQAKGWKPPKPQVKKKSATLEEEKEAREKEKAFLGLVEKAKSESKDSDGYKKACREIGAAAGKRIVERIRQKIVGQVSMDPSSSLSETDSTTAADLQGEAERLFSEQLTLQNLVKGYPLFSEKLTERTYLFQMLNTLHECEFFRKKIFPYELAIVLTPESRDKLIAFAVGLLLDHYKVNSEDQEAPKKMKLLLLEGLRDPKIVGEIYANFFSCGHTHFYTIEEEEQSFAEQVITGGGDCLFDAVITGVQRLRRGGGYTEVESKITKLKTNAITDHAQLREAVTNELQRRLKGEDPELKWAALEQVLATVSEEQFKQHIGDLTQDAGLCYDEKGNAILDDKAEAVASAYLERMKKTGVWGGNLELTIISDLMHLCIEQYEYDVNGTLICHVIGNQYNPSIVRIFYTDTRDHYNLLVPVEKSKPKFKRFEAEFPEDFKQSSTDTNFFPMLVRAYEREEKDVGELLKGAFEEKAIRGEVQRVLKSIILCNRSVSGLLKDDETLLSLRNRLHPNRTLSSEEQKAIHAEIQMHFKDRDTVDGYYGRLLSLASRQGALLMDDHDLTIISRCFSCHLVVYTQSPSGSYRKTSLNAQLDKSPICFFMRAGQYLRLNENHISFLNEQLAAQAGKKQVPGVSLPKKELDNKPGGRQLEKNSSSSEISSVASPKSPSSSAFPSQRGSQLLESGLRKDSPLRGVEKTEVTEQILKESAKTGSDSGAHTSNFSLTGKQ